MDVTYHLVIPGVGQAQASRVNPLTRFVETPKSSDEKQLHKIDMADHVSDRPGKFPAASSWACHAAGLPDHREYWA